MGTFSAFVVALVHYPRRHHGNALNSSALVDPFLKIVDAPGVFVVGDAASVMQNEHPVPGVAQAAI